jgi:Fic family protein
VEALLDYQDEIRTAIRVGNVRGVRARLMEDLVGQPIISVPWAESQYGVSYQAVNEAVRRLVEDGVLRETTGRNYNRLFAAPRVLAIVED